MEKYCVAKPATANIIWCMRIACWITKVTDTHAEYVILIAFPRQQWLHERASILRLYVQYVAFHVVFKLLGTGKVVWQYTATMPVYYISEINKNMATMRIFKVMSNKFNVFVYGSFT